MPLLIPNLKFLLDENVHSELYKFLKTEGFDVETISKGAPDSELVAISKKENRILVTNDEDFKYYTNEQIFAAILLKIPQNNAAVLINSFNNLLSKLDSFKRRLIVLQAGKWQDFPLLNGPITIPLKSSGS